MAVAVVVQSQEITPEGFDSVTQKLGDEPPEGILARMAGSVDDGFRVITVWESREQYERFREERLLPAIREVIGEEAASGPAEAEIYELHDIFIKPEGS